MTGTATDDLGVSSIGLTLRDGSNRYLQDDGTVSGEQHLPDHPGRGRRDQYVLVLRGHGAHEGTWKAQARATDTSGQSDLDTADRSLDRERERRRADRSVSAPTAMVPPTAARRWSSRPAAR